MDELAYSRVFGEWTSAYSSKPTGFHFQEGIYLFKHRNVRFITVSELEILTFTSVHVKLFSGF